MPEEDDLIFECSVDLNPLSCLIIIIYLLIIAQMIHCQHEDKHHEYMQWVAARTRRTLQEVDSSNRPYYGLMCVYQ